MDDIATNSYYLSHLNEGSFKQFQIQFCYLANLIIITEQ